ncbi:phospholipase D-like domain-containing protein [Actinomyces naeslundii]|uniref:phospholipase D-like domain-containing protein n=1 Tax=Actinomyces naeslundii TaxID=1655 RepID=UPI001EF9D601|nr:phospholipase D-like domain-containing protein [Actinomyces naeslundii]
MPTDDSEPLSPLRALGAFLTGSEADGIAARLSSGATLSQALVVVPAPRRPRARELLGAAGLGPQMREQSVDVLRAVAGAASRIKDVTPVWTAPAGAVGGGALTADVFALVGSANTSVVCATYNLQPSSALWAALVNLRARRPGVSVRLYLDTQAADGPFHRPEVRRGYWEQNHDRGGSSRLKTGEIARKLRGAVVMRTRAPEDDGRAVTSHAKFLSIDHRFLLVGSANFSFSAEERNVELGLRLDDPALAHSVEKQMRDLEETVYERVP